MPTPISSASDLSGLNPVVTPLDAQSPDEDATEKLLSEAKERFMFAQEHWEAFHRLAEDCLRFAADEDYIGEGYRQNRDAAGLPCLTENHVKSIVDSNANEFKSNIPAIQVDPDVGTDEKFATSIADLIRAIEQDSNVKVQYGQAGWYALATGLGFTRIRSEYESPTSFKQTIIIEAIEDPRTVLLDPNHKSPVGEDCEYAFILRDFTRDEYARKYPDTKLADELTSGASNVNTDTTEWTGADSRSPTLSPWLTDNNVMVVEYYTKEWETGTLYEYKDSDGTLKTTWEKPKVETNHREVESSVIKHYVLNDKEILAEDYVPGTRIPVVPWKGSEIWIHGKRYLSGIVKSLRDSQRGLDYANNWMAEGVMMTPKAKYIGTAKMFQNYEQQWADSNLSNTPYLPYNADPAAPGARPEKGSYTLDIQAAQTMYTNKLTAIKEIAGMSAAGTGEMNNRLSGPESGVARITRIEQSQMCRLGDQENIRNAIAQTGRILVEWIPETHAENGRTVTAMTRAGEKYNLELNTRIDNQLKDAKFKVQVESGGAYATRRQEAVKTGMDLVGVYPQSAPLIADLIIENTDIPLRKEMAARLRAAVPPNILAATEDMDKTEGPQMIANLKSQVSSLTQQLQKLQQEVAPDKLKLQKSEMDTAFAKNDKTWELKKITLDHQTAMEKLRIEEQKIILEGRIKEAELALATEELNIKLKELGMEGIRLKSDILEKVADRHEGMMDRHSAHAQSLRDAVDPDPGINPSQKSTGADGDEDDLSDSLT